MKEKIGCAVFLACLAVIVIIAFTSCDPNAPAPEPTKTPTTSRPPMSASPTPTRTSASSLTPTPTTSNEAYSRALTDAAWATYTDDEKANVCGALIIAGPDAYATAVADNPNLSDVDPDVAADELSNLCNVN